MELFGYALLFLSASASCWLSAADTHILYDTKSATSDLDWTLHPTYDAWEELSGLDLNGNAIRYHQVCNIGMPGQDNWARSPFIHAKSAKRVYIDLEYSVMKCSECRETFTLYYYPSATAVASTTFPPWREKPFIKIDTVAANARFESESAGPQGINNKTLAIGPLKRSGLYIAVQDQGACMSVMSMKLYYHYCPEITHSMAYFPKTVAGGDLASLIQVDGRCVSNAVYSNNEDFVNVVTFWDRDSRDNYALKVLGTRLYCKVQLLPVRWFIFNGRIFRHLGLPFRITGGVLNGTIDVPKYRCNSNGEWKVPTGTCQCRAGHAPNTDSTACKACPNGFYKPTSGNYGCKKCPSHSYSNNIASTSCPCQYGYYRSESESVEHSCTQPPSGPVDLRYKLNKSSVALSWLPPLRTGNRNDLYFCITCRECDSLFDKCSECPPTIDYTPQDHQHVTMTSVKISDLELSSYYIFTVTSLNEVSQLSTDLPSFEEIRVSTEDQIPSQVLNVHVMKRSTHNLTLQWSRPLLPKYEAIDYELWAIPVADDILLSQDTIIKKVSQTSFTLDQLRPGTSYVIKIRGQTEAGFGPFSHSAQFSTDNMAPTPAPIYEGGFGILEIIIICCVVALVLGIVIALVLVRKRLRAKKELADRVRAKLAGEASAGLLEQGIIRSKTPAPKTTRKTYVDYRDPHQGVPEFTCEIDVSKIKIERIIGQGEFGEVCLGKLTEGSSTTPVAVKRLRHGASLLDQTNFLREACTMAQFHDPNIVQFRGVVTKSMPVMILTEYMENGSLDKYLQKNRGELSLIQLLDILKGIASGMRYLANIQHVHRDLAARNILVDQNRNCKVSDFGLARTLENNPHATYTTQGGKIALRWTAPECIRHRQFTSASDVWSYGIVMWEVMSYGEKPYWDMSNDDVTQVLEDGYRLPAPENCPQALHNLMLQCWSYDERRRPNFQTILGKLEQFVQNPKLLQAPVEMLDLSAPLLSPESPTSLQDVNTLDEWLDMVRLGRYRRSFYANGIKDLETLAHITPSGLERLGIASSEHLSRLQSGLDTLRRHISAVQTMSNGGSSTQRILPDPTMVTPSSLHSYTLPPPSQTPSPYFQRDVALV